MNADRLTRKLTNVTVAALAGLVLASAPAAAQETGEQAGARQQARVIQVKILGMSCPFCAYGVEQKLKKLEGVQKLEVDLETGVATLTMEEGTDVPNEKLETAVADAGFEAAAIARTFESQHEDWNPEELPAKPPTGRAP